MKSDKNRIGRAVDLHTHSIYSDGTLMPSELVNAAKEAGLSAVSLTDHDCVAGVSEAISAGLQQGIEVVPGCEVVAEYKNTEIHILGYFIEYDGEYFTEKLEELKQIRFDRNAALLHRLKTLGMDIAAQELELETERGLVTRLHFAKVMAKKGYVKSVKDAFSRYLEYGKPAFVGRNAFEYGEAIEIIKKSGGFAVLAHPYIYRWSGGEVLDMVSDLKSEGLNGVETIYPLHSSKETKTLNDFCEKNGLLITGGSDFHGSNKPDIKIGVGKDNIRVDYSILSNLRGGKQ